MVYPALLPLMRTPRLPVVDWTDVPRRFKWTRPFRRKTKSGFCACAITFQLASTCETYFSITQNAWPACKLSCPMNRKQQKKCHTLQHKLEFHLCLKGFPREGPSKFHTTSFLSQNVSFYWSLNNYIARPAVWINQCISYNGYSYYGEAVLRSARQENTSFRGIKRSLGR